jgi:hypothetical protein
MKMYRYHCFSGRLFIVESPNGSGKSAQLSLRYRWHASEGDGVVFSASRQDSLRLRVGS